MFVRMVVVFLVHSINARAGSDFNKDCNDSENCINFCCDLSQESCEKLLSSDFFDNFNSTTVYHSVVIGRQCDEMRRVDTDKWFFENGTLQYEHQSITINHSGVCLNFTTDNNDTDVHLFLCYERDKQLNGDIEKHLHTGLFRVIGTSISLPCLIITLFVLWHMKQFQTNHGKCLMCHILSLILLYTFLILDRMDILIMKIPWLCEFSGYMMYISILFCIFWLNVLCFDIWKTFRTTKNPQYPSDSQKFYLYVLYGFGLPFIITMVLAVIDETTWFPEDWRPQIGKFECFLRNERHIEFFYLYLPMSLIILVNIILYSITAYKIYTVQNDKYVISGKIERRRVVSCNPIRLRFLLYLRLFLLMGLTWSMEAISWIFDANSTPFFIISDIANFIHGFIIFGLFVCRPNVVNSVITRPSSTNRLASSMMLGKFQDSKRNSMASDDLIVKFMKDKRSGKS